MFGQKKEETTFTTSHSSKSDSNQINTLISEGCKFEGNLFSPSNARIDGIVTGNLTGENVLLIGQKGIIKGDIIAVEATIFGHVTGNIKAHRLEIKGTGKVYGDAEVEHIIIEDGAKFNGKLIMKEKLEDEKEGAFDLPGN